MQLSFIKSQQQYFSILKKQQKMENDLSQKFSTILIECPVCLISDTKLYDLADCGHKFCMTCCIAYIDHQADNFALTKCLQQGCTKGLNKNKQVYKKVSQKTKKKLQKHEAFMFVQKNPQFKLCSDEDCNGYFQKVQKLKNFQCNRCKRLHCASCCKKLHQGQQCMVDDDAAMALLNYRKCPKCSIWVQKLAGCDYIDCKCDCKFCYACGNQFSNDPCRKKGQWKSNFEIRNMLKNIKIHKPTSFIQYLFFLPLLIIKTILSMVITIMFSLIVIALGLLLFSLFVIFGPLILIIPANEIKKKYQQVLAIISIIILYPLISGLFAFFLLLIVLLYPCLRSTYHHGIYDPFDSALANLTFAHISCMKWIWSE